MVLPSAHEQTHELIDYLDWNSYHSIGLSESFFAVWQVMPVHKVKSLYCKGSWLNMGAGKD